MLARSIFGLLALFSAASAAKVALFAMPLSKSHVIFAHRVAEEIAKEHEVVIIRPGIDPGTTKLEIKTPNVRELRTVGVRPETYAEFKIGQHRMVWEEVPFWEWPTLGSGYVKIIAEVCEDMVNNTAFMDQLREEKFDLALTHNFDACPVSVMHAAGIPQFGYVLPTPLVRQTLTVLGIPQLTTLYPGLLMDANNHMSFWQRLKNFVLENVMTLSLKYFAPKAINKLFREKYGDDFPSNWDLVRKATFLLVNAHADIEFPVPVTSKVTHIGGLAMSNKTKPLEEPYASFVEKAEKVVFVSFGTVAEPSVMPASWKRAFVELFEKNPSVHFIWRMDESVQVPANVLRSMWHPQKDVLCHAKVAAFITHGGYNSLGEAVASATPLITVPLFGDQFRNSRLIEYRGLGVRVDKEEMTFERLNAALHKILDNPSYGESASALSKIAFSAPVSAGDALRHAVNFALENPELNRDLPKLPFYQLYSLDIVALFFVFPLFIPLLAKWYYWSCCKMAYKEKEKMN